MLGQALENREMPFQQSTNLSQTPLLLPKPLVPSLPSSASSRRDFLAPRGFRSFAGASPPTFGRVFPFSFSLVGETSAFIGSHFDCKETLEALVFKVDLLELKREEMKGEVEEGRLLRISGESKPENEEKTDT
ncbi:17.3 kDa class I heat shock protein-like [Phalaenopsis equestris]|uniref:17.3 kDa class I heat shock protein-like n=1 Tax=Phalaenopsis equestris TaxID=78828 RepID=UPI0009E5BEF4|nr:17.3 kDa class I heat shock protein-like [Phalaenopsis equestris]